MNMAYRCKGPLVLLFILPIAHCGANFSKKQQFPSCVGIECNKSVCTLAVTRSCCISYVFNTNICLLQCQIIRNSNCTHDVILIRTERHTLETAELEISGYRNGKAETHFAIIPRNQFRNPVKFTNQDQARQLLADPNTVVSFKYTKRRYITSNNTVHLIRHCQAKPTGY